jgi:hypothetical protein
MIMSCTQHPPKSLAPIAKQGCLCVGPRNDFSWWTQGNAKNRHNRAVDPFAAVAQAQGHPRMLHTTLKLPVISPCDPPAESTPSPSRTQCPVSNPLSPKSNCSLTWLRTCRRKWTGWSADLKPNLWPKLNLQQSLPTSCQQMLRSSQNAVKRL